VNTADQTVNALGSTSASFSSSLTPVYTLGTIYNIDEKWSVSAAVAYLPIKTTATFNGPGATAPVNYPVTTTGEAKLNTTDYVIRLGYRF